MPQPPDKPMRWPVIIGIMAAMGVSGALIITRRKAQLAQIEEAKRARADES